MSPGSLAQRARRRWKDAELTPIGLHECRHAATLPDAMERAREQLDAFLAPAAADASHNRGG